MITEHPQQLTLDDTTEPVDIDTPPVLAAHAWPTNAHLIADVAHLGYLTDTDRVIDPTYGRGIWWQRWRPADLTAHDIRADGIDFRDLPHPSGRFDAAAYDPPYVCVGGRRTTTVPDLHDRYGLTDAPNTPAELQQLIADGLCVDCGHGPDDSDDRDYCETCGGGNPFS